MAQTKRRNLTSQINSRALPDTHLFEQMVEREQEKMVTSIHLFERDDQSDSSQEFFAFGKDRKLTKSDRLKQEEA